MITSAPESQAHNFVSSAQEGIDPRTGLFSWAFPLATLSASENQAPFLPLALSWSPLNSDNRYGLGTGFSLGMTVFDDSVRPGRLLLSSGEQYRVDSSLNHELSLRQCPLPTFRLRKVTVPEGKAQLHIEHKDGNTEILEEQTHSVWLPVRLVAPSGRYLSLVWARYQGGNTLTGVYDETNRQLYRCTPGDASVVTVWPDTDETLNLKLYTRNGYLSKIQNVSLATEPMIWSLEWEESEALRLPGNVCPLKSVVTPTGLKHSVTWTAGKMRFNTRYGAGGMPAVTKSRLIPGGGLPAQEATYRYSADSRNPGDDETVLDHNWLGYGAAFSDSEYDTDNDNLLSLSRPYHYWSEVTLKGEGDTPDTRVLRTYNRFHLMTEEKTWHTGRDCIYTQIVEYHADESRPLAKQQAIWAFPKVVTQTWSKGSQSRTAVSQWEYDAHTGNLLKQIAPDGTTTTMTYYPADGEHGKCPADPHGFERCLKSKTVTLVRSAYGDEPVVREEYTYTDIAAGAVKRQQAVVMPLIVSVFAYLKEGTQEAQTARSVTTFSYQDSDVTARDFGRVKTTVNAVHNDLHPEHPYETETVLSLTYDTTTHIQTRVSLFRARTNAVDPDFTAQELRVSRKTSGLSGRLISQTDAAGNTVSYDYDELGRPKEKILHPDNKAYQQVGQISYVAKDALNRQQIIHTDPMSRRQRTTFDALGNVLLREAQDMDGPDAQVNDWVTLSEYSYDSRGQVLSATTSDWLRHDGGGEGPLPALKTRVKFTVVPKRDDWGLVASSAGSDGLMYHSMTDPIACTATTWTTGTDGKDTPRTIRYYDPKTGHLMKVAVFNTGNDLQRNVPYSTVTQDCDGAGRLRKSTDPLGNVTTFTYDMYGRVDRTTLPDGAIVRRTWAPFSTAALPVSISVTDPDTKITTVLGRQRFDALGRVVSTTAAGRTTTLTYEADLTKRPNKNWITGPDGVVSETESDPLLGNAMTTRTVRDGKGSLADVKQMFRYNTLTGQLMEAREGNTVIQQAWRPSGTARWSGQQIADGQMLKSLAVHSLSGRLQQVTGVDENIRVYTRETDGPGAGRVSQVSDGKNLSVTMRYDTLLRISGWTATDLKGGHRLVVEITLDEYGRESVRTLTHSNGEVRTLTQTWSINGQLKTRTLVRSLNQGEPETLRAEVFTYDIRSRLKTYQVTGSQLPRDTHGNALVRQHFTFDALSNIRTCETTLDKAGDGAVITATYGYAAHDPCQLRSVTCDKTQYGYRNLSFSDNDYDKAGRLLKDEAGRRLYYDASGRLVRVDNGSGQAVGNYGYDAGDRLAWQRVDRTQQLHRLYYRGSRLVNEWVSPQGQAQDAEKDTLIRLTGVSQSTGKGGQESLLLQGRDGKGSLLTGYDGHVRDYAYGPYGQGSRTEHGSEKQTESVRGWNGEREDPATGVTHLGNGYRAYNPALMRFHCPDSLSPFGEGGINAYAYCAGDPINHSDPTGHLSWRGWLAIGMGILAVVVGVVTLGLGAAGCIALGVMAASIAVLDVASAALAKASGALEERDPALSEKLGWASLGLGVPGIVFGGVKLVQGGISLLRSSDSMYTSMVGNMLRASRDAEAASSGSRVSMIKAAATQGARVAPLASAARGGYSAEQTAHWDRIAIRGLGIGRLPGGVRQVYGLGFLAGRVVAQNIEHYGETLKTLSPIYTDAAEKSVADQIVGALNASRKNVHAVLRLNDNGSDFIERFFARTGALSKLNERLPLRGYTRRAIREAFKSEVAKLPEIMQSRFTEGDRLIALQDVHPFTERYTNAFNQPLMLPDLAFDNLQPDYVWQWHWPLMQ